jgi:hypothetical protein
MTEEDFVVLKKIARHLPPAARIGVFSPIKEGERRIFRHFVDLPRRRWDLNHPGRDRFDVLVASNVFMYSEGPGRWFRNALSCCRYLVLIDLVRRRRSPNAELGTDGDCMRYRIGGSQPRVERQFDLGVLGDRLLAYKTYAGGANAFDPAPEHVAAIIRGDLAEPVLRVDDYPTGIRPLLDDLTPIHDVLRRIDERGVSFYLGIVPALLTKEMASFLRSLRHLVPVAHGYDHAYPRYSKRLLEAGDPLNDKTVTDFDEFEGVSYRDIVARLRASRDVLEQQLSVGVDTYIPVCNTGDRKTGQALQEAGYDRYLSERRISGCELPWIWSDFYGRSSQYDVRAPADVVTLHATWEWDAQREGGTIALDRLLSHLQERRARSIDEQSRFRQLFNGWRDT